MAARSAWHARCMLLGASEEQLHRFRRDVSDAHRWCMVYNCPAMLPRKKACQKRSTRHQIVCEWHPSDHLRTGRGSAPQYKHCMPSTHADLRRYARRDATVEAPCCTAKAAANHLCSSHLPPVTPCHHAEGCNTPVHWQCVSDRVTPPGPQQQLCCAARALSQVPSPTK